MEQIKFVERRKANTDAALGKFFQSRNQFAYSDDFLSTVAATTGVPILLIDPEFNHNGILLISVNVIEYSTGTPPFWVLLSQNKTPLNQNDGDAILAPSGGVAAAGAFTAFSGNINNIYLPANYGLYQYPISGSNNAIRQGVYRKL